ncbi:MAG: cytochrome c oxidase subunit II [Rhizobiaceae bacterium]
MRKITAIGSAGIIAMMVSLIAGQALAAQPQPWQIWHQEAASDMAARIIWFDWYTLYFIVPITIFVMVLLLIVMVRYRKAANPEATKTSHNSLIEALWTGLPIVILIFIAIPSFDLLNRQLAPEEEPELTLKATGYQWYWGYEYQDDSELSFDSVMLQEGEFADYGKSDQAQYPRLLAVDNELVVPVDTMVRVLVTAADVLHAFTVPAFGFKIDAVPGRMNETWFKADREGLFYGQCSELCGKDHAFMPIAIRVVSKEQFETWKTAASEDLESANEALMAAVENQSNIKLAKQEIQTAE